MSTNTKKWGKPPMVQPTIPTIDPEKVWQQKNFLNKGKELVQTYSDGTIKAATFLKEITELAEKLAIALKRKKDVEFFIALESSSEDENEDYEMVDVDLGEEV